VLPHEQAVELVKVLGFEAFDLAVMGNRSHVRPEVIREDIPGWAGRLEERIRGRGLEIADVFCIPWTDFQTMAPNSPDVAERERGTALFRDMLELTVRLGAPGRVQCGLKDSTIDYGRVVAALGEADYRGAIAVEYVWVDWERCNECDNISETILLRDRLRAALAGEPWSYPASPT
jgi:sugar phosphate isomerase/epimerase